MDLWKIISRYYWINDRTGQYKYFVPESGIGYDGNKNISRVFEGKVKYKKRDKIAVGFSVKKKLTLVTGGAI